MKKLILLLLPLACFSACAEQGVLQEPTVKNELRAPAYPLVSIDPYTSAWSMTDNLYDGSVKHWTGKDFPLIGVLRVDGVAYRFMGTEELELTPVVPTSEQGKWLGRYTTAQPANDWTAKSFNDASWSEDRGAFGTKINEPTAKTDWTTEQIWVRRGVTLDESLADQQVYLEYSNDDDAIFYINGIEIHNTGATCNKNAMVKVPAEAVSTLVKGENLIAAQCKNPVGNGLLDFGLLIQKDPHTILETTAVQTSVDVQATQTHYAFTCGGVDLRLTFTAPLLMDDLSLLSRPVNYISYQVASNDNQKHEVQIYFEASPRWALDQPHQESVSECFEQGDLLYLKSGSKEQNVLAKSGDDLRIDWGYFYLAADKANTSCRIGTSDALRTAFVNNTAAEAACNGENQNGRMSLTRDMGSVDKGAGKVLIGYDDLYSIQYFGENLRPYWNAEGDQTIVGQFEAANKDYASVLKRCFDFDNKLMAEATQAGGKNYAELCALAYRQALAAHKLVKAPNGDLMFLSKENNSNGSIGTVDITYPSAPLFLYYNPELAKALMNHIYYYSESGKWPKPFPSHDVGTYPRANGQTYGGDMPIEEAGNMLVVTAAACVIEGDASYAEKHWDTLTTWTDYLAEYGLDPENQLCTDDFAGHFAHNVNLSAKAIVGVACYGRLAEMLGRTEIAEKYTAKAREMAAAWVKMASDGDHYRLTFDQPGTWSQKYNLVWDKLLKLNIFPAEVAQTEIASYLGRQNQYGLPLDNRATYTKTDWIIWTATMAEDQATFEKFIDPVHLFMNQTVDRVPMSDWVFTDKPNLRGFKARAVVGGYYIKMLESKL
ncbi:MAG: DUF4965 domain-containing protein [Alistipes sp.]